MARQKVDAEIAKFQALKVLRATIRLKHSLAADRELNERLPALEAEIERRLAAGEPFDPDAGSVALLALGPPRPE